MAPSLRIYTPPVRDSPPPLPGEGPGPPRETERKEPGARSSGLEAGTRGRPCANAAESLCGKDRASTATLLDFLGQQLQPGIAWPFTVSTPRARRLGTKEGTLAGSSGGPRQLEGAWVRPSPPPQTGGGGPTFEGDPRAGGGSRSFRALARDSKSRSALRLPPRAAPPGAGMRVCPEGKANSVVAAWAAGKVGPCVAPCSWARIWIRDSAWVLSQTPAGLGLRAGSAGGGS